MIRAILGSAVFLMLAPGTVAYLLPRWIHANHPWPEPVPLRFVGASMITAGLFILLDSFVRFAVQGLGTPAPVLPTKTLAITGLYRHVRNPMYIAVVALILGQGLMWADASVLSYGGVVWLISHVFVMIYEEPSLERTFGREYTNFRLNVPRWIPRISPWTPHDVSH